MTEERGNWQGANVNSYDTRVQSDSARCHSLAQYNAAQAPVCALGQMLLASVS